MSLPYAFLLFPRESHWTKSFETACTDNNHVVVTPWICITSSNITDAWKVTLLSCMHVVLCLFSPTEKLACFKIWVTLGSYFPVNMCFFNLCLGQKKPFQINSFRAAIRPRVRDSGTHRNNIVNSKISSMSPESKTKWTQYLIQNQPIKHVLLLNWWK